MGMYTELHFASQLKNDIPIEVRDLLKDMTTGHAISPGRLPDHPFFKTSRWDRLFNSTSAYFDGFNPFVINKFGNSFYLCGTTNIKNYENEIQKFIDWISPYLNKNQGNYIGHIWYEEWNEPKSIKYLEIENDTK